MFSKICRISCGVKNKLKNDANIYEMRGQMLKDIDVAFKAKNIDEAQKRQLEVEFTDVKNRMRFFDSSSASIFWFW